MVLGGKEDKSLTKGGRNKTRCSRDYDKSDTIKWPLLLNSEFVYGPRSSEANLLKFACPKTQPCWQDVSARFNRFSYILFTLCSGVMLGARVNLTSS